MNCSISAGQVAKLHRVFRQADFDRFAAISGDDNPIHVDPAFSARTKFGRTVAHGMLLYSVVCGVLKTRLPGPGTLQMDQEMLFPNPTFADEEVTAQVQVTRVEPESGLADLTTLVLRADGKPGLEGRTRVRLPGAGAPAGASGSSLLPASSAAAEEQLKGIRIGQRAQTQRAFGLSELAEYMELSGDTDAVLADAAYARRLGFEGPVVPGGLLGGMISFLLGTRLPGQGTNYLKQRLEFPAPAYADQELTAVVEVVRLRPEKQLVNLLTTCQDPSGKVVCRGQALVLVSDVGA